MVGVFLLPALRRALHHLVRAVVHQFVGCDALFLVVDRGFELVHELHHGLEGKEEVVDEASKEAPQSTAAEDNGGVVGVVVTIFGGSSYGETEGVAQYVILPLAESLTVIPTTRSDLPREAASR